MRDKQQYNEYQKKYQLARYHRRRQEAFDYLGNKCVVCGVEGNLEIDHIDPSQKEIKLNKLWSIANDRFWAEIKKCQLLCEKHHLAKTSIDVAYLRPITHGKYWAAYEYKCNCELCKQFKIDYAAQRREKRKSKRL